MAKFFSIFTLVLTLLLFPPAALALVSNDAVPGDATYPIKRKLEEAILLVASVSPTTKAWFSVEQSNRRFKETTALLAKGVAVSDSINELVLQTSTAADEINQIKDPVKKAELIKQLSDSISKYDQGLSKAQKKIAQTPTQVVPTPVVVQQTPTPTFTPVAQTTPSPSLTPAMARSKSLISPQPSSRLSVSPSPVVKQQSPTPSLIPSPNPQVDSPSPVVQSPVIVQPPAQPGVSEEDRAIEEARRKLKEIQEKANRSVNNKNDDKPKNEVPKVENVRKEEPQKPKEDEQKNHLGKDDKKDNIRNNKGKNKD